MPDPESRKFVFRVLVLEPRSIAHIRLSDRLLRRYAAYIDMSRRGFGRLGWITRFPHVLVCVVQLIN